jgi:hypothetical protein
MFNADQRNIIPSRDDALPHIPPHEPTKKTYHNASTCSGWVEGNHRLTISDVYNSARHLLVFTPSTYIFFIYTWPHASNTCNWMNKLLHVVLSSSSFVNSLIIGTIIEKITTMCNERNHERITTMSDLKSCALLERITTMNELQQCVTTISCTHNLMEP